MNVALEPGELFGLDFEHRVLEWKASEIRPSDDEHTFGDEENIMISSSDHNLETAKKKNSKAGSKIKFTPKANPGYLQEGLLIKISMTNKSVKPDLWQEAFRTGMWAI